MVERRGLLDTGKSLSSSVAGTAKSVAGTFGEKAREGGEKARSIAGTFGESARSNLSRGSPREVSDPWGDKRIVVEGENVSRSDAMEAALNQPGVSADDEFRVKDIGDGNKEVVVEQDENGGNGTGGITGVINSLRSGRAEPDQGQARLERARREAQQEARQEAFQEFRDEYQKELEKEFKQEQKQQLAREYPAASSTIGKQAEWETTRQEPIGMGMGMFAPPLLEAQEERGYSESQVESLFGINSFGKDQTPQRDPLFGWTY